MNDPHYLQQVMGSLSAYSSTSKVPMVVVTVANLDIVVIGVLENDKNQSARQHKAQRAHIF
jgi:hypothetical protein